jgi:hypothetical protein
MTACLRLPKYDVLDVAVSAGFAIHSTVEIREAGKLKRCIPHRNVRQAAGQARAKLAIPLT